MVVSAVLFEHGVISPGVLRIAGGFTFVYPEGIALVGFIDLLLRVHDYDEQCREL